MQLNNSTLHHHILTRLIDTGSAPSVAEIAASFGVTLDEANAALKELADYHGVVLHPGSNEVWVIHPFATTPTNFWIESGNGGWWGNCAWCSLGAAALLDRDLKIYTTLGGEGQQRVIELKDGKLVTNGLYIHFPVPMAKAWDNVMFTCSVMLMFEDDAAIDNWCERHSMIKGDVQPIENVWEFAKVWYGNHLDPDWKKWTTDEARQIFARFGLTGEIWSLPVSDTRF